MSFLQTHSGRQFDFTLAADRLAERVALSDIVHALANICRFGGHIDRHYSVAAHSLLVTALVKQCLDQLDYTDLPPTIRSVLLQQALLHDAAEAYVGDMPAPLKKLSSLEGYVRLEQHVLKAIGIHFALDLTSKPWIVEEADRMALVLERRALLSVQRDDWGEPSVKALWPFDIVSVIFERHVHLADPEAAMMRKASELGLAPQR